MKTVLVTGATGRVGANLAKTLVERGYSVRSFVMPDDPKASKLKGIDTEIIWGSLTDADRVCEAVKGTDAVVHLGFAMGRPAGMSRKTYFDINVGGTFNVFEAALENADRMETVVCISSDASYPATAPKYLPMDERHPQNPAHPYGVMKLIAEDFARSYHAEHGLPTAIIRYTTILAGDEVLTMPWNAGFLIMWLKGVGTQPGAAMHVPGIERPWEAVERALEGRDPSKTWVIPRGPDGRSWMHHVQDIRDTVEGTILAMEKPQAIGEAFNIMSARGTTWEEAVKYICERTGDSFLEVSLPNFWAFESDVCKARHVLGYEPKYDIRRMIDDALAYQQGRDLGVIPF